MMKNRVVITGLGVVAPNGFGIDTFWDNLIAGRSGIRRISHFDPSLHPTQIAGEVPDFDINDFSPVRLKEQRIARQTKLAVASAKMALDDSGLGERVQRKNGTFPLLMGISTSAIDIIEVAIDQFNQRGPNRVSPYMLPASQPQQSASTIASLFPCISEARTLASACAAGMDAVAEAAEIVKSGRADMVLAGGSDAPITKSTFAFMAQTGLIPRNFNDNPEGASRPFDRKRECGVISEGAAMLLLENLDHAIARGSTPYAEILGSANTIDPDPITSGSGYAEAIAQALHNACVLPQDIDYICAHAPGHPILDRQEALAIREVFGDFSARIPVSSVKGMIGNPLAAAGPIQVVGACLVARQQFIPPTANLTDPEPGLDLDLVQHQGRNGHVRHILINCHGLGGGNTSLVLKALGTP